MLTAPANDASATFQWNVYSGTDTTVTPIATATDATLSFPPDNGTFTVTLSVTDSAGMATDTETITAFNVPPTASVTGSAVSVPGLRSRSPRCDRPVHGRSGGRVHVQHRLGQQWDGGQTVTGPAGTTVTHTFATTGTDTVSVTATDKDGGVSATATLSLQVKIGGPGGRPAQPGQELLAVGGTDGADNFNLILAGRAGSR